MKVLVTGGAGFIGSHLVNTLVKEHDVVVLDNLSKGKMININPKATFIKGDILEKDDVKKAVDNCDIIFHLAALTSGDDDLVYKTNYIGTKNICEAAGNRKVVFASSAAVYGNTEGAVAENTKCNPVSAYGKSKLDAESLLKNALILRFFNVYGPGGSGAVNIFCDKISKNQSIILYGDGLQTRDFVNVSDVVNALLLGFQYSGIYNVGTGKGTTLLDLIKSIEEITANSSSVRFLPARNEILNSRADISKITNIGWQPSVKLEEGLESLLENYLENSLESGLMSLMDNYFLTK